MNLVSNKQLLLNVSFQLTKYREEELCADNKVQVTIGDVYCSTCRNEKCVFISTNKMTIFYDCKKWKACCHVLNAPFNYEQFFCLAVMINFALQERRVATKKNKTTSIFEEIFQPIRSEPELKSRSYSIYGIFVWTPHWLIRSIQISFTFSFFYTFSR